METLRGGRAALHSIERRASKTGLAMARAAAASGRFHFEDTECRIGPLARLVRNAFEIAIKKYKPLPDAVLVRLMRATPRVTDCETAHAWMGLNGEREREGERAK